LIKYIKSVLWRAAKHLYYIQDARCLKVKYRDMYKASSLLRIVKLDNTVQMKTIPVLEAEVQTIMMSLKPKNST
jgi:hypothetical protein